MAFTFRWVPTPGQDNNFVNGGGKARALVDNTQQNPFDSPLYICIPPITFAGGNGTAATLLDFARLIATCGVSSRVQQPGLNYNGNRINTGGALTINGNPCGNYEFNVLPGGTTLNQASVATLFSSTEDISTWIIAKGDLTISAATVLIPTVNPSYTSPSSSYEYPPDPNAKRKLFMVVYAKGNLLFEDPTSLISMSACGGNSSSTGANIASFNIPIASNLYYYTGTPPATSGKNPTIQSVGAAGGAAVTGANGITGDNASFGDSNQLYTGGGGSGAQTAGTSFSGAGGSGSPFSGGTGGGGASKGGVPAATAGSSLGGAGGNSSGGNNNGGTGNTGGSGSGSGVSGLTGTGGILIVITEGFIAVNSASVKANGVNAVSNGGPGGGASGGGIIAAIQSSSSGSFPNSSVNGGYASGSTGGKGGNGTSYNYGINS
jgi:hypothetical protein